MKTYMKEPFHVSWFLGQLPKLSEVYSFQEYTTLVNGAIEERATATLDIEPENERQQSLYTHYKHRSGEQTDQQSTLVSDAKIFPQAQDIKEVRLKATRRKTLFHKTGAYIGFSNLVRCGKYFNLNQDEKSVKRSASPSSEPEQAPPAPKRRLQKV
ncbi:hypothetical protein QBC41DRAFT_307029 [Cercophora samala]|uniref:Uncharacterized protein n=1 Tax=Cercophora samala TaxID=330535 RepID=A0AA40D4N4_9PEZI|nr:hypothetical protein QBC41DRAFT_307029 [Cercophora samala]